MIENCPICNEKLLKLASYNIVKYTCSESEHFQLYIQNDQISAYFIQAETLVIYGNSQDNWTIIENNGKILFRSNRMSLALEQLYNYKNTIQKLLKISAFC